MKEWIFIPMTSKMKRHKKSFLLLEVLISIVLLTGVSFALLELQKQTICNIQKQLKVCEAEIAYQAALAELLQGMQRKQFDDAIKNQKKALLELEDAKGWRAQFQFTRAKEPEVEEKAYIIKAELTCLEHKDLGDFRGHLSSKMTTIHLCIKK